jgi:hypothetical protein
MNLISLSSITSDIPNYHYGIPIYKIDLFVIGKEGIHSRLPMKSKKPEGVERIE